MKANFLRNLYSTINVPTKPIDLKTLLTRKFNSLIGFLFFYQLSILSF